MTREEKIKKFIKDKMLSESETGKISTVKEDSGNFHRGKLLGSKFGVTGATLEKYKRKKDPNFIVTKEDIAAVDLDTASKIAYEEYYKKYNIDKIDDDNLAMNVLDFAYNSGGNRALRWLRKTVQDKQKAKGETNKLRVGKGKLDEEALNIINSKYITNNEYSDQRQQYIDIISKKEKNKKFKEGWTNRVNSLRTEEQLDNEESTETNQTAPSPLSSSNPLGDLNPLASTMGSEMANEIENPGKKFTLVSGPDGKDTNKKYTLVSGPQPEQETEAETQEPDRPQRTMGQSFMQGVGQGFSYGAADEIAAGAATLDDMITTDLGKQVINDTLAGFTKAQLDGDEMPITRLADQYRKHRDDERALVDQYRGDNPLSYTAGEIAGTFLNYAAVGPLAFGAGMLTRGGKVLYGTLSGMAHNLGSSEEETIEGLVEDTARGGVIGATGELAFPAFKQGVQAAKETAQRVRTGSLIKFLGGPGTDPRRRLGEVGKKAEDFAERMVNYNDADGTPLIKPFMNRKKLSDTLNKNADRIGDKMSDILSDIDEAIGKPVINGYHLRNEVREQVIKPLMMTKSLPEDKAIGAALEDYIIKLTQSLKSVEQSVDPKTGGNVLKEVFEPQTWSLSDLAKQKSKLQSMYRKTRLKDADNITVGVAQGKDRIANVMGEFIEKELKGKNISPEISTQYNAFKQAYGDMAEASYIVKQQIERDAGKDIFQRIFNDSVVRYTSMASLAGTMVGLPYSKVGIAVAGFKALSESKRVNGVISKSAEKAVKILEKNPDATAAIANRLVTSTALSADDFFDNMTKSLAELTFIDQPLSRDPNEVIRRSDKLLHLIEDKDKEMAANLETAIDNRDLGSISALMDKIVKVVPAQYVEPGIGFGGRAFSEEDILKVNSDIQNVRNTRRRKQLYESFNNESSEKYRMIPLELYEEKQNDPANFFKFKKKQNKFIKDY